MKTHKFARKPFYVDAARVSEANLAEIAEWCEGTVETGDDGQAFIRVKVHRPLTERQTQAFVGDWVLFAGTGFKVYTPKAFDKSFEKVKFLNKEQADIAGIRPPHEPRVPKNPVGPKGRPNPNMLRNKKPVETQATILDAPADPPAVELDLNTNGDVKTAQDAAADALIAEVLNAPKEG